MGQIFLPVWPASPEAFRQAVIMAQKARTPQDVVRILCVLPPVAVDFGMMRPDDREGKRMISLIMGMGKNLAPAMGATVRGLLPETIISHASGMNLAIIARTEETLPALEAFAKRIACPLALC